MQRIVQTTSSILLYIRSTQHVLSLLVIENMACDRRISTHTFSTVKKTVRELSETIQPANPERCRVLLPSLSTSTMQTKVMRIMMPPRDSVAY